MKAPCCLIGPNRREEYSQAVLSWLQASLQRMTHENLQQRCLGWVAKHDELPPFTWGDELPRIHLQPAAPTVLTSVHKTIPAARRWLYQVALRLLEQGRPCDLRALRQRMKDEGVHR